jgi:uracil-DNA glycosylase family 4
MKNSHEPFPILPFQIPPFQILVDEIVACEKCPRLRRYGEEVARVKRRAYRDQEYWGKPIPGFGDPRARLLIIGLAPGAHGANRTGRMFTGDRSGDFLYRALFENDFATQPESWTIGDGLKLKDAYITGAVRCAPPDNKPTPDEFARCRPYLERELDLLTRVRVVVALGKLAADAYLGILRDSGVIHSRARFPFGHAREYIIDTHHPVLLCSYHPSQQNTSTGRLTAAMLREVFARVRAIITRGQ